MLIFSLFACGSLIWVAYELTVAVPVDQFGVPEAASASQASSQHDDAGSTPLWAPIQAKV